MTFNRAVLTLQMVTLTLLMLVLTGCCHNKASTLQGNEVKKLQQNESAPFSGWLIQDEALARILEKAEACQKVIK